MTFNVLITVDTGNDSTHNGYADVTLSVDRYSYGSTVRGLVPEGDQAAVEKFIVANLPTVLAVARAKAEREAAEAAAAAAAEAESVE